MWPMNQIVHTAIPATEPRPSGTTVESPPLHRRSARLGKALVLLPALLPALLTVGFAFRAGGFFPGATGAAAAALALALALRATLGRRPFAPMGTAVVVAGVALAGYTAWTLVSASWSDAPGRALVEFDRGLLYLFAFLLCASFEPHHRRLALAVRALAVGIGVVCLVGWTSRVLPEVIAPRPGGAPDRLSFPLTYWNSEGLLATIGLLLAVHLATSVREPRWSRALGAAMTPLMASTLYFTFSRGAFLAAVVGLVVYVVALRSRALLAGALTVVPTTALALVASFGADRLAREDAPDRLAVAQGHDVATAVAVAALVAVAIRLAADRWLAPVVSRAALPPRARRPVVAAVVVLALAGLVVAPLALGAPGQLERQWVRFVKGNSTQVADQRDRILNPGNNGRIDHWRVAAATWKAHRWTGTGAGTFEVEWNQRRRSDLNVRDAHSLYVETLSDLGIVGGALLLVALATIAVGALVAGRRRRRAGIGDPAVGAVFLAALAAWSVHAGLDWMWETPAVTIFVFALGGMVLARRPRPDEPDGPGRVVRVAIGLGCLALAVIPVQIARSQAALDRSVAAFRGQPQDCAGAIGHALDSLSASGARPQPWEIIGYCDVGAGQGRLAVSALDNAVRLDPENWTYRYGLALVQAAAGLDPRPAAKRALELNPREPLARAAVEAFGRGTPRSWPRLARRLQLPSS